MFLAVLFLLVAYGRTPWKPAYSVASAQICSCFFVVLMNEPDETSLAKTKLRWLQLHLLYSLVTRTLYDNNNGLLQPNSMLFLL